MLSGMDYFATRWELLITALLILVLVLVLLVGVSHPPPAHPRPAPDPARQLRLCQWK